MTIISKLKSVVVVHLPRGDWGVAMVLSLMALTLLAALGASLVLLATMETRVAASVEAGTETFYAADGAIEWAVRELGLIGDWSEVLGGSARATFADATRQPSLASRERLDLNVLTAELQAETDAGVPLGPNTPRWRLFAWGPFARLTGALPADARTYVGVWVADDESEVDGNPAVDVNGTIRMHAEAFGSGRTRRAVEATARRVSAGADGYREAGLEPTGTVQARTGVNGVALLSWREVR